MPRALLPDLCSTALRYAVSVIRRPERRTAPYPAFPSGWTGHDGVIVGHWSDVANPPPEGPAIWTVKDGDLWGGKAKSGKWVGTWLMSEKEYGDFILEVGFKFMNGGAHGNGGIGLRAALKGDPAYTGVELQNHRPTV